MSSKPTSDDATERHTDPAATPVGLGKPDSTPTEVLKGSAAPGGSAEWWHGAETQDTEVTRSAAAPPATDATEVLHPGEAAYAPGATVYPQARTGSGAGQYAAPTAALPGDPAYASGSGPVGGGAQQPPGTPPPPSSLGGQGGPPSKRKGRIALIVTLIVALLVVGGLIGGEAYARNKMESCISSQFEQQMGSKVDVSFGAKPLLLTMFDNKVSSVRIDSDDTKFGPAQGMVVHATFNDVVLNDNGQGGTIGSSTADVTWSNEGIAQTLGGLVSGVTSDPNAGTLSFTVLGGLAQLQVKPAIVGDKVQVETLSASLLGFGLPTDLVSGIVELMTESLQTYPMGLAPTKVQVTGDGLHVSLKGGHAEIQSSTDEQPVSC